MSTTQTAPAARPWWAYGHVWLLIAGPAAVVAAGLFTWWLAWQHLDPVLTVGPVLQEQTHAGPRSGAGTLNLVPAQQARNHAQTGMPERAGPVPAR